MASDRHIRILHLVRSLEVGGLENGVVNLLNRLQGDDFTHGVCCLTQGGKLVERIEATDVKILELGLRTEKFHMPILALRRFIRGFAPDILHTRGWSTVDGIFAARIAGVAHVIHGEHGREAGDPQGLNRKRNLIRKCLSPLVDRFVAVSDDLRAWLIEQVGISALKVNTIHNGVDTDKFAPRREQHCPGGVDQRSGAQGPTISNQPSTLKSLRRALGLPEDAVVIGMIGRLDPVKDHGSLLRAFAKIAATDKRTQLAIVGDGPMRGEIEAQIGALQIGAQVHLLGERQDIPDVLQAFDIFALTSIAEGISNTILEAMASGLPVVATRVGGNPELVERGVNGHLLPARDASALASALLTYVNNAELRRLHGLAARQRAVDEFSLDRMAAQYASLYRSVAGQRTNKKHRAMVREVGSEK